MKKNIKNNPVKPNHYNKGTYEPFNIIDHYELDFYEGNVLKYLLRWRKKNGVEDLEKAMIYLEKRIKKEKKKIAKNKNR